ncbi:MAG: hypothetical protein Q7S61_03495 [bacterium]|nr:hypothetical protein [bacterium]
MDSFNKIISFVLGLVVVVVFLAILSTKFNLNQKLLPLAGGAKATPTPTKIQTITPSPVSLTIVTGFPTPTGMRPYQTNTTTVINQTGSATAIPKTGVETIFLPFVISTLLGGAFLRKTGKK